MSCWLLGNELFVNKKRRFYVHFPWIWGLDSVGLARLLLELCGAVKRSISNPRPFARLAASLTSTPWRPQNCFINDASKKIISPNKPGLIRKKSLEKREIPLNSEPMGREDCSTYLWAVVWLLRNGNMLRSTELLWLEVASSSQEGHPD